MAYWLISYIGESGSMQTSLPIKAETREQAISLFGRPPALIHDVKVDHLGGVRAAFERKFPLIDQVLMLSAIASKLVSGKIIGPAIKESVDYQRLGLSGVDIDRCETPKEYFSTLRFDDTVITLAEAGDKVGKLSDSLYSAAEALQERLNANKEYGSAMRQGLLYTVLGSAFMIGIPLWGGATINEFMVGMKLQLKLNNLTHFLIFLHVLYTQYFVALGGAAVGFYVFREWIWDKLRSLPVFSFFNDRMKIARGLDFITFYQLLTANGFNNFQTLHFMASRSRGLTRRLYIVALERLGEGRPLAEIFETSEWPKIIYQNLQGFEAQNLDGRNIILINLKRALRTYYLEYTGRLSRVATFVGFSLMVFNIFMFAIGFYLPLWSLTSAMKQG